MMKLALCISGGLLAAGLGLPTTPILAAGGWGYPPPGYGYGPMPAPYGMPMPWQGPPRGPIAPPLPHPGPAAGQRPEAAAAPVQAEPAPAGSAGATTAAPQSEQPGAGDAAAVPTVVQISQMRFDPPRITVQKGTTVTWQQRDQMPHTVTAYDGSFSSPRLTGGGAYSRTFDQAGTFAYYCGLHPSMRGEVQVVD